MAAKTSDNVRRSRSKAPALTEAAPAPSTPVLVEPPAQTALDELPFDFDEELYLILNPDVADSVKKGIVPSGAWHWVHHGAVDTRAGQRPSISHQQHYRVLPDYESDPPTPDEIAGFDAQAYLEANQDVYLALSGRLEDALDHWIKHGRFEGRLSSITKRFRGSVDPGRLMARPFGVNLFAPLSAQSGLGTAARGYLRALRAANVPVHLVNIDHSTGPIRIATRDYDIRPPYRVNLILVNADTLERFFSLFRKGWFDDTYSIAMWAWELNILRPDWFMCFAAVDEVWTLSRYNAEAVQAVAPVPVLAINPVVTQAIFSQYDRTYFNLPHGFLFLTTFDVGSSLLRKNPDAVVDAFITAFRDQPDVYLILKFHSAKHDLSAIQRLLRRVHEIPNIIVRSEVMLDEEIRALQACANCLVSAHRSEGFGLNIAEFMLTGKPVIVTAYSGNMDFTDASNSYLVPFTLRQLSCTSGPYLPGYLWAEPNQDALVAQMRRVVDAPEEARSIGAAAHETIRGRLSAETVGRQISERMHTLGLQGELPAFMSSLGRSNDIVTPQPRISVPVTDVMQIAARPTLSVVVPVYNVAPEYLSACIESVRAQIYSHWELCLCDDASTNAATLAVLERYQGIDPRIRIKHLAQNQGISAASNSAVTMATGGWLVMLDNDDELTPDALGEIAAAVVQDPTIDALYSDEDKLDIKGDRCDTYYKPSWSPEHLESVMYTLHPLTVRTSLFLHLDGFRAEYSGAQDWDLMLRISRITDAIHHIPKILYHWRMILGSASAEVDAKPAALDAGARALSDHVLAKYGVENAIVEPASLLGHYRVRHSIRDNPPVTVLITTNNSGLTLPDRKPFIMVENLIQSILERTSYDNYRIVVVDNANTLEKQSRWMKKMGVDLHSYYGRVSPFNYPDKVNFALRKVQTEHLVLMNDDMEVINNEWLSALLEFSQNSDIGACGGKLLHEDGTIQHVGTVLGISGGSAHVYHGFPGDFVGYNGYTHVIRNYSAMTGACLATRRSVLNEIGGWDPRLAIDYNDVDLCLRMRQHGYRLVYTPYSQLKHFESKTAIRTAQNPAEVSLFQSRWGALVDNDPYYNPNLSRSHHDFSVR